MKHITLFLTLITAVICHAQDYSKMSRYVRQQVMLSTGQAFAKGLSDTQLDNPTPTPSHPGAAIFVLIKAPEEAVSPYCLGHKDGIHICQVPTTALPTLSADGRVVRIEASKREQKALLERSADIVGASDLWQGTALPQAFLGEGTVVGVIDIGFDYRHPTFRSTKDGHLRISRIWDAIDIPEGQEADPDSPFPLGTFLSDTTLILKKGTSIDAAIAYHGTHTSSTAAGSGWDTPYRGMAPEADIYLATTALSDNKDIVGEENEEYFNSAMTALMFLRITEYADSLGKPCVINYSIGGPQDMTNEDALFNEMLSAIFGSGHILVTSAGNSGGMGCHLPKSATQTSVGGRIQCESDYFTINISTRKTLKLHIKDCTEDTAQCTIDLDFLPGNTLEESPAGLRWNDFRILEKLPELGGMTIAVYSGCDGFDSSKVGYDIFLYKGETPFSDHDFTIEVEGEDAEAEIFSQKGSIVSSTNYKPTLCGAEPHSGNVSSPGSLPSVLTVGATNHSNTYTNYHGSTGTFYAGGIGQRATFSSCGPSLHGFMKPDVVAPGNLIVAAASERKWSEHPDDMDSRVIALSKYPNLDASTAFSLPEIHPEIQEYTPRNYPWLAESGTSMSSPIVAGIVALWLEADPTLSKDDVLDVIARTASHPDPTLPYPNNQYGYGEIDAYRGLLHILNLTGIEGLSQRHLSSATVRPTTTGELLFTFAETTVAPLPVRLYSTSGQLLRTATVPCGITTYRLPISGLHGLIAVQADTLGSTLVRVR